MTQLQSSDILLSIKPKYVERILSGQKTVELRKKRLKIDNGTRVWIYSTTPIAAIVGCAIVSKVECGNPSFIWEKFGNRAAVTRAEFDSYFSDTQMAYALILENVFELKNSLSLKEIRKLIRAFRPPQFFQHLNGMGKTLRLSSRKSRSIQRKNASSRRAN